MKTRKKLLIALLSATCLTAGAFGITACSKNSETNDKALVGIYNAYVAEANEKNEEPLSYEAWLKDKFSTVGQKGEDGKDGNDGKSAYEIYRDAEYKADRTPLSETAWLASLIGTAGVTPHIGENGNWYLGNSDTGVKAEGADGVGVSSVEMSADGKSLVVSFTSGNPVNIPLPENITHVHKYNNEYTVLMPATGDHEGLGYKVCTEDGCDHIELVTIATYSYKVTVYLSDAMGEGVNSGDATVAVGAKVTLKNDKGEKVAEAITDANGEAIFEDVEKGVYAIEVTKEGYISYSEVDEKFASNFGVTAKNAADYPAMLVSVPTEGAGDTDTPYEITSSLKNEMFYLKADVTTGTGLGGYEYVEVENICLTFTASEAGVYTFKNNAGVEFYNLSTNAQDEVLSVALDAGETLSFQIQTSYIDDVDFEGLILLVSFEETDKGSKDFPASVKAGEEATLETEEEAYFKIIRGSDDASKVKITFDEDNVTVYAVGLDVNGSSKTPLSSGDYIDFSYEKYGTTYYSTTYYLIVSAKDGHIAFATEPYYEAGSKRNPVNLDTDKEYNVTNAWYKIETDETVTYTFHTASLPTFDIYSDADGVADKSYSGTFSHTFEKGTYYINAHVNYGEFSFTVSEYNAATDKGLSVSDPIEAENEFETLAGLRYYTYTAESVGYVVISGQTYVNFTVYTDANFSEQAFAAAANKAIEVNAGDKVYFTVNSIAGGETLAIEEVAADAKIDYTVTLNDTVTNAAVAGVKVVLKNGEETVANVTTDENGVATFNVAAGNYSVVVELTDEQKELYTLSANSDDSVSILNRTAVVSLISCVNYEVTVEDFDLLEDAEGVKVELYSGTYGWLDINWSLKQSAEITDGKATFNKVFPTAQLYKFVLAGLPEGYTAEEVTAENGTTAYVLKIKEAAGGNTEGLGMVDNEGKTFTVNETGEYKCTVLPDNGNDYVKFTITVTGGTIQSLNVDYDGASITGGDSSKTVESLWGGEEITFVIVPNDGEEAEVTVSSEYY